MTRTLQNQYLYGKPTGNVEVVDENGRVVMTFRKRLHESREAVRERAQKWIDEGAQGTPGAAPKPKRPIR